MAGPWEKYAQPQRAGGQVLAVPESPDAALNRATKQADLAAKMREAAAWNASHNPDGSPKVQAPSLLGDPTKTGAEYLATLPQNIRGRVQQLLDGRSMLTAREKGQPLGQQLMDAANQADPTFDENVSHARYVERQQYTGQGKGSLTVQAAERIAQHVNDLYAASKALGGPDLGWAPLSNLATGTTNSFRQAKVASYNQILPLISGELQKLTKNGTATVDESNKIEHNLRADQPEDVRYAAMKELVRLGRAQYDPLRDSWASAWQGTTPPPMPMDFSKPTTAIFDNIEAGGDPLPMKRDKQGYLVIPGVTDNSNTPTQPPGVLGPGFSPPPTGATNAPLGPSTDGLNSIPDPQSGQFWADAARQGTAYRVALRQWQSDVRARGLVGTTPPPPGAYHKAASYIRDHPNVPYQPFSSVTHTPVDPLDRAVTDAAFSGPAVAAGHAANAVAANIPTALAGEQGARYNAVSGAMHPNYAMGGDVAGTIAGVVGTNAALKAAAPGMGQLGRFLTANPGRQALTADVGYGITSGAAQNPDNPLLGAAEGGGTMLAGNAAGRFVLGPAVRAIADMTPVQRAMTALHGRPFAPPVPLNSGQRVVMGQSGDALGGIRQNLTDAQAANLPYMLADSHPKLRVLAGSAVRKSPDVRTTAEALIPPRQAGQGERAIDQINSNLAPVGDVPTIQADLLKRAQKQSAPLYDAAKAQPVPELTAHPALKEILDRPAGQAAIRNGFERALNNGEEVGTLTYATDPQGNPVQYGNPSWNVIHYARQALDANGETALRRALDKQIAGINPGFKAADAAYSGILKGSDALQAGADATGIKVTPEATHRALAAFPKNTPQFQQGYASNMADQIERQRLTGNPYSLINGSIGQRAKLGTVFPRGAAKFSRAQALEGDMSNTAIETLGGSPTQARKEADDQFIHPALGSAAELGMMLATGAAPTNMLAKGARWAGDAYRLGLGKQRADAIAPILFNQDPAASLRVLDALQKQAQSRQIYQRQTNALGGAIAAPAIFGLTQQ